MRRRKSRRPKRKMLPPVRLRKGIVLTSPFVVRPTGLTRSDNPNQMSGCSMYTTPATLKPAPDSATVHCNGFGFVFEITPLHLLTSSNRVEATPGSVRTNVTSVTIRSISIKVASTVDVSHIEGSWTSCFVPYRTDRDVELWKQRRFLYTPEALYSFPRSRTGPIAKPLTHRFSPTSKDRCGRAIGLDTVIGLLHVSSQLPAQLSEPDSLCDMLVTLTASLQYHYELGNQSFAHYSVPPSVTGSTFLSTGGTFWYDGEYVYTASESSSAFKFKEKQKLVQVVNGKLAVHELSLSSMEI